MSGVLIACLAGVALYQLKLAKDGINKAKATLSQTKEALKLVAQDLEVAKTDLKFRVKREAVVIAAAQCAKFAEDILPLLTKKDNEITAAGEGSRYSLTKLIAGA